MNRRGKPQSDDWLPMRINLINSLTVWESQSVDIKWDGVNRLVNSFNEAINYALHNSIRKKSASSNVSSSQVDWDPYLFHLSYEKIVHFVNILMLVL